VNPARELSENAVENGDMVNTDFEPRAKEEAVLEVFKTDRETVNPMYLREQTDLGKGDINTALTRLTSAGWVRKVTRGLYEFVEDPRDSEAEPQREPAGRAQRYDVSTEEAESDGEADDAVDEAQTTGGGSRYEIGGTHDHVDDLDERVAEYVEAEDIPPKTDHGRGAALDVFRELRAAGSLKTSKLQERVYANYEDNWSDGRTMWNAIDRHLEKIPGVQKGGYGEWEYAGDDAVLDQIQGEA
jgi:hypothetical protein